MDNFFIAIRHSTQHSDRGWNRTSVAIIILISTPPLPTQPMSGCNTPPGSMPPTRYKKQCGFFYIPQESEQWKELRCGLWFFILIQEI